MYATLNTSFHVHLHPLCYGRAGVVIRTSPPARGEPPVVILPDVVPAVEPVGEHSDPVVGHRAHDPPLLQDDFGRAAEYRCKVRRVCTRPESNNLHFDLNGGRGSRRRDINFFYKEHERRVRARGTEGKEGVEGTLTPNHSRGL